MFEKIDLLFGIISLFSTATGLYRGVIWELLKYIITIIGLIAAFIMIKHTFHYFEHSDYMLVWLGSIGFITFLCVSGILMRFLHKFNMIIKHSPLNFPNRLLGGIFGILRAVAFICLMYSGLMVITNNQKPTWLQQSAFAPKLDQISYHIHSFLRKICSNKFDKLLKLDELIQHHVSKRI